MSWRAPLRALYTLLFGSRISLDDLDEQARRRVRAAQIDAVVQLVPLTMTINILNAAVIIYVYWDTGANTFLMIWGGLIAFAAGSGFLSWSRTRRNKPRGASLHGIQRTVMHAAFLGLVWGAAPYVLFPDSDTIHQLLLAATMAGMISGGAFCLSTVPAAGLVYTWTIVLASVTALIEASYDVFIYTALLLIIYAVFLTRNMAAHGALFVSHLRNQLKLEAQSEVIGLLLNDFEQHASDWLWETDARGSLVHVSDRFAEVAGKTAGDLQGALFSDVIGGQAGYRPQFAEILKRIDKRETFRDLVLPVPVGDDMRYWSLSGKPIFDAAGAFTGYRGAGADVTEKRIADQRITHLARYDTLTQLPNRSYFQETADVALAEARAKGWPVALLCFNLDQFKSVNDTLGHVVGDALLKQVGRRLRACARDRDTVARLGGDEFAILHVCPELPAGPMVLARQIIDAFKAPFKLYHGDILIDASLGIAVAPADGWKSDVLLKRANLALYAAKAEGAGKYRFFEPEMEAGAHRRRALEIGLRSALDKREIELVFQPVVDMRSGAVTGCEALVRWKSAEWGYVSPAEFIPVAESTGLIEPIGEYVLREAVEAARHWPADTFVAVNLSPVQFRNQKLLATVVSALAESGLPPHRLELEVTESLFIDGSEHVYGMLQNLRALGVRTALDDFGTAFPSTRSRSTRASSTTWRRARTARRSSAPSLRLPRRSA